MAKADSHRRAKPPLDACDSCWTSTRAIKWRRIDTVASGAGWEKKCRSGRWIWIWHTHKITRSRVGSDSARDARDVSPGSYEFVGLGSCAGTTPLPGSDATSNCCGLPRH